MNVELLTPISKDIVNVLQENEIEEHEYITVLTNILNEIKTHIEVPLTIEDNCLNFLRDMVWYNLERSADNYTLSEWGSKYPILMNLCDMNNYIEQTEFFGLNKELLDIRNQLPNFVKVFLSGNENLFSPLSHVYIPKVNTKTATSVVCTIKEQLSQDELMKIKVDTLIINIIEAIEKADNKKAKILVKFIDT